MRIEGLEIQATPEWFRMQGVVHWENADKPSQTLLTRDAQWLTT